MLTSRVARVALAFVHEVLFSADDELTKCNAIEAEGGRDYIIDILVY